MKKTRIVKTCLVCNHRFEAHLYSIRNGHGNYCGIACAGFARRGKPNGQRGIPRPEMRGAGNVMTRPEVRAKQKANARRGENHPQWKGGVTSAYKTIRKSSEYIAWRTAVFERDHYTCQICGLKPGMGKRVDLQADHIKPFAMYPELRFELTNGRTLCIPCHQNTDTYGGRTITLIKQGVKI